MQRKRTITKEAILEFLNEYRKTNHDSEFFGPPLTENSDYADVIEDSLDAVDCLFQLEEYFGFHLPDEDLSNYKFDKISDFVNWLLTVTNYLK